MCLSVSHWRATFPVFLSVSHWTTTFPVFFTLILKVTCTLCTMDLEKNHQHFGRLVEIFQCWILSLITRNPWATMVTWVGFYQTFLKDFYPLNSYNKFLTPPLVPKGQGLTEHQSPQHKDAAKTILLTWLCYCFLEFFWKIILSTQLEKVYISID